MIIFVSVKFCWYFHITNISTSTNQRAWWPVPVQLCNTQFKQVIVNIVHIISQPPPEKWLFPWFGTLSLYLSNEKDDHKFLGGGQCNIDDLFI